MTLRKKLEKYDNVNELATDVKKNLDALATDLQNQIQGLYNEIPDGPGIYGATGFTCLYKMAALETALEKLNNYFKTNYETNGQNITNNGTKPVRKENNKSIFLSFLFLKELKKRINQELS